MLVSSLMTSVVQRVEVSCFVVSFSVSTRTEATAETIPEMLNNLSLEFIIGFRRLLRNLEDRKETTGFKAIYDGGLKDDAGSVALNSDADTKSTIS